MQAPSGPTQCLFRARAKADLLRQSHCRTWEGKESGAELGLNLERAETSKGRGVVSGNRQPVLGHSSEVY